MQDSVIKQARDIVCSKSKFKYFVPIITKLKLYVRISLENNTVEEEFFIFQVSVLLTNRIHEG